VVLRCLLFWGGTGHVAAKYIGVFVVEKGMFLEVEKMERKVVLVNMDKQEYIGADRLADFCSDPRFERSKFVANLDFLLQFGESLGRTFVAFSSQSAGYWSGDRLALVEASDPSGLYAQVMNESVWREMNPASVMV